eukprot:1153452-Pelagomonas_calceolata.AAC.4
MAGVVGLSHSSSFHPHSRQSNAPRQPHELGHTLLHRPRALAWRLCCPTKCCVKLRAHGTCFARLSRLPEHLDTSTNFEGSSQVSSID